MPLDFRLCPVPFWFPVDNVWFGFNRIRLFRLPDCHRPMLREDQLNPLCAWAIFVQRNFSLRGARALPMAGTINI